jgi:hypothetical protein
VEEKGVNPNDQWRQGVQTMPQYEYKSFSGVSKFTKAGKLIDWSTVEQQLNGLIAERWEVVSANASPCGLLVFGCGSQEPVVTFILRRSLQS